MCGGPGGPSGALVVSFVVFVWSSCGRFLVSWWFLGGLLIVLVTRLLVVLVWSSWSPSSLWSFGDLVLASSRDAECC